MHLKNLSLIRGTDKIVKLSPAYDLVCTRLVLPKDQLALTIRGKRSGLTRNDWLEFANYAGIPEKAARRVVDDQIEAFESAEKLIGASYLPDEKKEQYVEILRANTMSIAS
jgi:serine/threonine-protein kinase HipA